nr:rhodopsin-like isoform X1 [Danaus plexippus plexippus]XP_032529681.1 rhodopsin-like isoform X1 [Danaus plexippus plexippus]
MSAHDCVWSDIFDEQSRTNLQFGFLITGALATVAGFWLNSVLLLTDLRSDRSYRNLAFFTFISFVRRAASIFNFLFVSNDYERSIFSKGTYSEKLPRVISFFLCKSSSQQPLVHTTIVSCEFFGFVETFFAVYEYECLTHVCIERYVVAKYITNGWPIQKNHYILFQGSSLFFSALYAFPPVFGLGRFGLDFSCQSCILDMVLTETWDRYVTLTIFLLRSVKSTGFIVTMLVWARNLEAKFEASPELLQQKRFTESVVIMTVANIMCWLPIALIRGWVLTSQVLAGDDLVKPSATVLQLAIWLQWAAPAFTTAAMFFYDERIHKKMVGDRCNKEELSKKE